MKHYVLSFLSLTLVCCTQNQLILDPFDEGESLIVQDDDAIAEFEAIMADINTPERVYQSKTSKDSSFFDSLDVINTCQYTQPRLGICRNGDREYYYHIEEDVNGTLLTDLDQGITDYVVTPEKYEQIREYIRLHTPVPEDYTPAPEEDTLQENEEES